MDSPMYENMWHTYLAAAAANEAVARAAGEASPEVLRLEKDPDTGAVWFEEGGGGAANSPWTVFQHEAGNTLDVAFGFWEGVGEGVTNLFDVGEKALALVTKYTVGLIGLAYGEILFGMSGTYMWLTSRFFDLLSWLGLGDAIDTLFDSSPGYIGPKPDNTPMKPRPLDGLAHLLWDECGNLVEAYDMWSPLEDENRWYPVSEFVEKGKEVFD